MSNAQQISTSTWTELEADKAFGQVSRARRRAALVARLRRARPCGLTVFDETLRSGPPSRRGVREIPLEAIQGTTEPNRAAQFDQDFRPARLTRRRWQRVWLAFHRGATLPPITVVRFGDAYAIRDGHHRVSVAKALGAPSIPAIVAA
jgi:ParB-like nuclease domain